MRLTSPLRRLLPLAILAVSMSCGSSGGSTSPASPMPINGVLSVEQVASALRPGETAQLTAVFTDTAGARVDVTATATWTSSNPAVVTVSKGLVTGVAIGSANVTAAYQGNSDRKTMSVSPPDGEPLQFRVAIISGERTPSSEIDVRRVFGVAQALMLGKTGVPITLVDYVTRGAGVPDTLASAYLAAHASTPPDGILVLSDDETATTFGGYSTTVALPPPWFNRYPSPFRTADRAYVAVVDFDHFYGRCGYNNQLEHVSATSFGGECRNVSGVQCSFTNGLYWTCPDVAGDYYAQPDIFAATSMVHEFAHPFGPAGNFDHYGTATCISRTGMSAADAANTALSQHSFGMCPDVYKNFKK